jgi:hypothetical protein
VAALTQLGLVWYAAVWFRAPANWAADTPTRAAETRAIPNIAKIIFVFIFLFLNYILGFEWFDSWLKQTETVL